MIEATLEYEVTVTNNNSGACPSEIFDLVAVLPGVEWGSVLSATTVTLGHGAMGLRIQR